ncbi:MAG: hypothetical protein AB8B91_17170 [Rubripirellula sp.]
MLRLLSGSALFLVLAIASTSVAPNSVRAAELYGLTPGTVELESAGPLAFGPSGVLFIGDAKAAKIYAINTEDEKSGGSAEYHIDDLAPKVSAAFGGAKVTVADLAVNPETGNTFMSVSAGGESAIAKVTPAGEVSKLNLDKIANSVVSLPNAPEDKMVKRGRRSSNPRSSSITDVAYTAGRVLVAGLAAGDSPSAVREFDFPFNESGSGFRVEIFHAAHGKSEDYSPIQTFVPFNIGGEPSLLAGYVCTPLVKIPVGKASSNSTVKGTTVAELGNRNRPLDMIVYQQHGKAYLLMANSARGVMKISTEDLESNEGLTEPVRGGGVAGQKYETIESMKDVTQLDKLSDTHALLLVEKENGPMMLHSVALP